MKGKPTTFEVGALWNAYILESLVHHVFSYYLVHIGDEDIQEFVNFCHNASASHLKKLRIVITDNYMPVPVGTTSKEINLNAPRLYSDVYYMIYIKNMAQFALSSYALAFSQSQNNDIKVLFREMTSTLIEVEMKGTNLMLEKGIYPKTPVVPIPDDIDFVGRRSFLTGFFGDIRPVTFLEINQLYSNALSNAIGKALLKGFIQTTKTKEIREYFIKGRELANKDYLILSKYLKDENSSAPATYDNEVTDSTIPPFSERLMLSHVGLLSAAGVGAMGMAMSASPRRDLATMYGKMLIETGLFSEAGAKLLIDNEWMEQPPMTL